MIENEITRNLKKAAADTQAMIDRLSSLCLTDSEYQASAMKIANARKMLGKTLKEILEAQKESEELMAVEQFRDEIHTLFDILNDVLLTEVDEEKKNCIIDKLLIEHRKIMGLPPVQGERANLDARDLRRRQEEETGGRVGTERALITRVALADHRNRLLSVDRQQGDKATIKT